MWREELYALSQERGQYSKPLYTLRLPSFHGYHFGHSLEVRSAFAVFCFPCSATCWLVEIGRALVGGNAYKRRRTPTWPLLNVLAGTSRDKLIPETHSGYCSQ